MIFFVCAIHQISKKPDTQLIIDDESSIQKAIIAIKKSPKYQEIQKFEHTNPIKAQEVALNLLSDIQSSDAICYINTFKEHSQMCQILANDIDGSSPQTAIAKRTMALRFEECFINQTQRYIDQYPWNIPDDLKPSNMKDSVYNIYNKIQDYVTDLCFFSNQAAYNQDLSDQMSSLLSAIIKSSEAINDTQEGMDNLTRTLAKSIEEIFYAIQESSKNIIKFTNRFQSLVSQLNKVIEFQKWAEMQMHNFHFYVVVVLSAIGVGVLDGSITVIIILMTVVEWIGEWAASKKWNGWNGSHYQTWFRIIFVLICAVWSLFQFYFKVSSTYRNYKHGFSKRKYKSINPTQKKIHFM